MIGLGAGTLRQEWPSPTDRQGMFTCPRGNAPGRGGKYADDILQGFSGILQVPSRGLQANPCRAMDGYAGYNRLLDRQKNGDIKLAYCWAHARRKLYDVAKASTAPIAQEGLKQIAAFYRIEADIKGQSADARLTARIERTKPKLAVFERWLAYNRTQVSARSPTGEALKYIAKYWNGLNLFLTDGRIEIDNNPVERTIRPIALNRKNALFAGHEAGAQNWAMHASLIETCKLNAVEPHAYISGILTAIINGHKQSDIEALLPRNFKA